MNRPQPDFDFRQRAPLPPVYALCAGFLLSAGAFAATESVMPELKSGHDIYQAACASCHGTDGKGAPRPMVGFDTRLPDFTDCAFATKEPDVDWSATIHNGGPARGFSTIMPAYGDSLSDEQIREVTKYMRSFCKDKSWPQGDLNLPRAMVTEKAFPENEVVLAGAINAHGAPGVGSQVIVERRIGSRGQIETIVPYNFVHDSGPWVSGLGDILIGYKHMLLGSMRSGSIFSVGGEVTAPTGDRTKGTGGATTIFETFASYGQILPADTFYQFQTGIELPAHTSEASRAYYARSAFGKTFYQGRGLGRGWTPMVEFIADRDLVDGAKTNWDFIPQFQIPLAKRMHILASVGFRIPMNNTADRPKQAMFYLLWDFADGSLRKGW